MNTIVKANREDSESVIFERFLMQFVWVLGVALYLYTLFWIYAHVLVPRHMFFAFNEASATWSWSAFALALIPIAFLPKQFRVVTGGMLWVIYLLVVAPTILLMRPLGAMLGYDLALGLIVALVLSILVSSLKPLTLPRLKLSDDSFLLLLLVIWSLANGYILMRYGLTLKLPSFGEIYQTRTIFSAEAGSLVIYIVNWTANVLNVLLLIMCLRIKRRRYLLFLVLLSQLDIYGLTGYKSVLVPLILIPFVLLISDVWWRKGFLILPWGLITLLVIATPIGYIFSPIVLALVDRAYLAPASLTVLYYQYFQQHPLGAPVYAIFRLFYDASGSSLPPQYIIGSLPVFPLKIDANANLFADGYANFGWLGFIVIGILFGVCLWLIKSVSRGLEFRVTIALFLIATLYLLNAGLPTTLLTHGLFFMMLFTYLMPRSCHHTSFSRPHAPIPTGLE